MESRVVLVTGCSTGLGRDLVGRLAKVGHKVVATARRVETLEGLEAALKLQLDVTDQTSVDEAVGTAIARLGGIDVLINNAGFSVRGAIEEVDETKARAVFDTNVWGLLRVSRAVLPHMRERHAGRIIHVGSVVGRMTWPINGIYAASKHAVEAIADSMRMEVRRFGIDVTLIEPGTIASEFFRRSEALSEGLYADPASPYAGLYRRFRELAQKPSNRGVPPCVVSRTILAAIAARRPKARYLTAASPLFRALIAAPTRLSDEIAARVFSIDEA